VLQNKVSCHAATPRWLIFDGSAFLNLCRQPHPHFLDQILSRVSIPQQPADEGTESVPVTDKLGSSLLNDFGFTGHSKGLFLELAKGGQSFLATHVPLRCQRPIFTSGAPKS
jgi:hypothetical protein